MRVGSEIAVAPAILIAGSPAAAQVGEPRITDNGTRRTYDYGPVPENFAPGLPEDLGERTVLTVNMEKTGVGSLIVMEVTRLGWWNLPVREDDFEPEVGQHLAEDMSGAMQAGGQVLSCKYNSDEPGIVWNYRFWFKARPEVADPARLETRIPEHPMNMIGKPIHVCPPTADDATAEKRSG